MSFVVCVYFIFRYILAKTSATGLTAFYALESNAARSELVFRYREAGRPIASTDLLSGVAFLPNVWYHVAVVLYSTQMVLYVNGVRRTSHSLPGRIEDISRSNDHLHIGARPLTSDTEFSGKLERDCCRVFACLHCDNFNTRMRVDCLSPYSWMHFSLINTFEFSVLLQFSVRQ